MIYNKKCPVGENIKDCGILNKQNSEVKLILSHPDKYLDLVSKDLNKMISKRIWSKCKKCSIFFQHPRLDLDEMQILYSNVRSNEFRGETPEEYFERITSLPPEESENFKKIGKFKKYINITNGKILDIGSGAGVFLYTFSKIFPKFELYAVDASPQFANYAKKKFKLNILNDYFENLGKNVDYKFDVITVMHVFEHVDHPSSFLNKIKNYMHKDSVLIIQSPDIKDFDELQPDHIRFAPPHLWFYGEASWKKIFNDHKFNIVDIYTEKTLRNRNNITAILKI